MMKQSEYYSPVGKGKKVHIFQDAYYHSLCGIGPPVTRWIDTSKHEICKACIRKKEKRNKNESDTNQGKAL